MKLCIISRYINHFFKKFVDDLFATSTNANFKAMHSLPSLVGEWTWRKVDKVKNLWLQNTHGGYFLLLSNNLWGYISFWYRFAMMGVKQLLPLLLLAGLTLAGDINRQSIIFYPESPDLFYCPQEKSISLGGMIVKARPLEKL